MTDNPTSFMNIIFIVTCLLSLLSVITAIVAIVYVYKIKQKIQILCAGKDGAHLEDVIMHANEKIVEFDTEIQELFAISNTINKHAHKSIHRIGLVRFNPFHDHSGNQSFALALLNSANDGIVMSSIHTREGTRIYTKEIQKGLPVKNELTKEEKDSITNAQ